MKVFTGVVAASAIFTLFAQLATCKLHTQPKESATKQDTLQKNKKYDLARDSQFQEYSKGLKENLKIDSTK